MTACQFDRYLADMDRALNVVDGFSTIQDMLHFRPERGIGEIVDQKDASEQASDVNAASIYGLPTRC